MGCRWRYFSHFFGSHFPRLGGIFQDILLIIGFVNSSIYNYDIGSVPFAEIFLSKLYLFASRLLEREYNNSSLLRKIMCTAHCNLCLIPRLLELSGSFGGQTQRGPRGCVQNGNKSTLRATAYLFLVPP